MLTNNKNVKELDFYNSNNVFIYGVDDLESIDDFMNTPFQPISEDVRYKYTIERWVRNFF